MRAAIVEKPGHLVIRDVPVPGIADHEALVKVLSTSICNATDNHILHGIFAGYHDYYPQVLGHEVFGTVERLGPAVTNLQLGDRVVLYHNRGAFCEYAAIDPSSAARVSTSIPDRAASLCEMLDGAWVGAVYPAQIQTTEHALLVGQGPMGLTATAMAAVFAKSVSVVDYHQNRLDAAVRMGAKYTYNRSELSSDEIAARIHETVGGADVAVMCIAEDQSPELDAFDMAAKALKVGARMTGLRVDVKQIEKNHRMDPHAVIAKEIRFCHTLNDVYANRSRQSVMQMGVDLVASGRVNLEPLITHEATLEELPYVLDLCDKHQDEVIKVVVYPGRV